MRSEVSRDDERLTAAVITVSDRSARGEREDLSGPTAATILEENGFDLIGVEIVPDEAEEIVPLLRSLVSRSIALVITTGGTGFSPRDITPEATLQVIERRADGISEEIRRVSREKTPFSMVSRGVAGIAGETLIVNLPGSPKGVAESLEAIVSVLPHALRLLRRQADDLHQEQSRIFPLAERTLTRERNHIQSMSTDNLLFLHGALYESSTFGPIIDRLPERFAPHAFDFPGHGSAPFPDEDFSIPLFGESTIREMDRLGMERASIFGFSMGGYVGLWLARHHPGRVERVMTLGTKMDWNPEGAAREVKMLDHETIDRKVPQFGATLRARHGEDRWVEVLRRTAGMMEGLGDTPALSPEDLQQIEIPVRMMVGDRDRMVTIEETVGAYRRLPHGELAVLPDTGHPLESVELDQLVSTIEGFC